MMPYLYESSRKVPGAQTVDKALLLQGFAILLEPLF